MALRESASILQRSVAADKAEAMVDDGSLFAIMRRRVAYRTEPGGANSNEAKLAYLQEELLPELRALGFNCTVLDGKESGNPILIGQRFEAEGLPTILGYGHGDVVCRATATWRISPRPWELTQRDGSWYGCGSTGSKGQHTINLAAMRAVIELRGHLGFNAVWLVEMAGTSGSPGLRDACMQEYRRLAADVLIASAGARVSAARPTVYLGSRGTVDFTLAIRSRLTSHHSGDWGGLLSNPAIELAHAITTITSATGRILVPGWAPEGIPEDIRVALARIEIDSGPASPGIARHWGEPGLSAAEQLYGWSSFEVLNFSSGDSNIETSVVPPTAHARCQLRTAVGVDESKVADNLRAHLDRHGHPNVYIENVNVSAVATRLNPRDSWVRWACESLSLTTGKATAVLPNIGGSLPNDVFLEQLGMRTIWIPHSYPGAKHNGEDEHIPVALIRESLRVMASLYWDLGDSAKVPPYARRDTDGAL